MSTSNTTTTDAPTSKSLSESDVYDRQIRLWGAESQQKMQKSRVLYIHVTGVSAEVLKNLALAGIKATLCDSRPVTDGAAPHFFTPVDAKRQKYASIAHSVRPLVEELNPLLGECPILEKSVEDLTPEDLKTFSVILASQIPLEQAVRLSQLATAQGCHFYLADCFGWNGVALMDLGRDFTYRPEQGKELLDPRPLKKYVSLPDMVAVPLHQCTNRFHKTPPPVYLQHRCLLEYHAKKGHWPTETTDMNVWSDFLKEQKAELPETTLQTLAKSGMAQVVPVCAVLGGMLGNEIIKVISGKGEPANNTLLFDGKQCKAWSFLIEPKDS